MSSGEEISSGEEMAEEIAPSPRYCAKCGRPTKGHSRPWGAECTLAPELQEAEKERPLTGTGQPAPQAFNTPLSQLFTI